MPTGRFILVVEDNADVAVEICEQLDREGYRVQHVSDGEAAISAIRRSEPDLVLLDRMLPRVTGDEVAQQLRTDPRSRSIPIIMLTGKADETDELVGLALGVDDYITKPFSPRVLLARIANQLRKRPAIEPEPEPVPATSVKLDRKQPRVFIDQTAIPLTSTEYKLLATLMAAGGTVLEGHQLAAIVFGQDRAADEAGLAGQVCGLQRKMGPAGGCIHVIGEHEYAFCVPRPPRPLA